MSNKKKRIWIWVAGLFALPCALHAQLTLEECYRAGAAKVTVEWTHQPIARLGAEYKTEEVLGEEQAADAFVTLTKDLVVTPKEMDEELLHLADVMAAALNRALHPDFDRL